MTQDQYQRVSQDDADSPLKITQNHRTTSLDYYHDNAYDDPSDQDSLLEKEGPSSPGLAERGDAGSRRPKTASPVKDVRN